jgi:hypothetical protein
MSPADFAALLEVARAHKVRAFELGDVKVTFSELAFVPEAKTNPTEFKPSSAAGATADPPPNFRGIPLDQLFPDG